MIVRDPLHETQSRTLFKKLSEAANGFNQDQVVEAAVNLLVNAVRQNRARRADAERLYDEVVAKGKYVLLEQHYDTMGKRRPIFPFHQVIEAEPVTNLSKLRGT